MRNRDRFFPLVVLLLILQGGCATNGAPPGWLDDADALNRSPYGGWIDVQMRLEKFSGEFIAFDNDSLYVASDHLRIVAARDVLGAQLTAYESHAAAAYGLFNLGTLTTISNGWLLIITAPIWFVTGNFVTIARSYRPRVVFPDRPFGELRVYARFPQGLPPSVDRSSIRSKEPADR